MAKRNLKLPDDLDANLRASLHTLPPSHDILGSRKSAPKPKPRKRKRPKDTAPTGTYVFEMAPVLDLAKLKKAKAVKKRYKRVDNDPYRCGYLAAVKRLLGRK